MDLANWALRTSPKFTTELNISAVRVFDHIRDLEIPITLRPQVAYIVSELFVIRNEIVNDRLIRKH